MATARIWVCIAVAVSILSTSRSASARRRRSFDLLALKFVVERGFLDRNFVLKALRINERVWGAGLDLGVFLGQVVHRRMRSKRHIDVSGMQEFETLSILSDELRIEIGRASCRERVR